MVDLKKLQKEVINNKIKHGFNTTDINMEFCLAYGEMGEAYISWLKERDDVGEELADVAIYLLGISEILGIDLGSEIEKKVEKNSKRVYKDYNGVLLKEEEIERLKKEK